MASAALGPLESHVEDATKRQNIKENLFFCGINKKMEENSWESACELLSGWFLQLMNCHVIRSFPSAHTI